MKLFGLLTIFLMGVLGLAYADECSMDSLPQEIADELEMYDKGVHLEPVCLEPSPVPAQCNFMDISQDCCACFMTCDGANKFLTDTLEEIEEWGALTSNFVGIYINFCPDGEVDSMDECPTIAV